MTAVILAAGIASRLRPLTDTIPKSLLPLKGKPLLRRTLEALQINRVERCVIVTGYRREIIEHAVEGWALKTTVEFVFNPRFARTTNTHSLWVAGPCVRENDLLLLDGDILFDPRVISRLLLSPHENALLVRQTDDLGHEEVKVEIDFQGRVKNIGKQIDPRVSAGESVGIERFSRRAASLLFETLDGRKDLDEFYEATFQEMIERGTNIHTVDCAPYVCIEIDTIEDLRKAELLAETMET